MHPDLIEVVIKTSFSSIGRSVLEKKEKLRFFSLKVRFENNEKHN
jgi:hypothetical protein